MISKDNFAALTAEGLMNVNLEGCMRSTEWYFGNWNVLED
jgi:hypothetical protein